MDKLSEEEQQIIYGIFFEEKTEKQLAKQMRISASAVGYRKRKILKTLLQQMKTEYK